MPRKKSSTRKKSATAKRSVRTIGRSRKKTGSGSARKSPTARKKGSGRKTVGSRKKAKRKYGTTARKKVKRTMHEMKRGKLTLGRSGKPVKNRKQAIAIALSEARRSGGKVPKQKKRS